MSPREINRRLDERGLEGIDSQIGDGRRSLHSIIDWTIGQLSPREREALDAVSVCAGFDLALVQSLLPAMDVVPAIESLMVLGLVHRVETNSVTTRFRLLETIRSAVVHELGPGQENAFRQLHASHFLRIAANWERAVANGATGGLSASFDADADNVRRALDYLETADPRQGLVLLARLSLFWKSRGRFREGYERFQRAAKSAVEPSVELVRAALEQVQFIWMAMPLREQRALLERTLEMARAVGDRDAIEETLRMSAVVELNANETPRLLAIAAELEAIASEEDLESRLRLMNVRVHVAQAVDGRTSDRYVDMQRAYVGAMQDAGRDLALIEGVTLAGSLFGRGEYEESLRLARAAVAAFQDLGREAETGWAMAYVGPALAESGRTAEAIDAALECASIALQTGHAQNIADALWAAMPVALAAGQPELVARLYGAIVRGMHARGEVVLVQFDADMAATWLQRAERAGTSELVIGLAIADGARADPVQLLQSLPSALRGSVAASATVDVLRHGTLTKREVEILALVGRGRTDPEIAAALFISPKTASVHVSNIKDKLGMGSRLEVALRARELGLVGPTDRNT
jgi:DNA-binding CsgD family transcriptional regulator